jgi:hypothetical protein
MLSQTWKLPILCLAISGLIFGQGMNTTASMDDWEEINFEFDSSVLTDGYPSLLRLAELLNQNAGHKVQLVGHADYIGSSQYNEVLAMKRANTVKDFLVKYGSSAGQITVEARGDSSPKVDTRSNEARFMNRRVAMTVTDGEGKVVGAGGVGDAIGALEKIAKAQEDCCDAILKKLDKLDEILAALKELRGENQRLREDVDALKTEHGGLERQVAEIPKAPPAPTREELAEMAEQAATKATSSRFEHFALMGLNVGTDHEGQVTWSGRGRYFRPFSSNLAVQAEGEYLGWSGRKEGQFDIGMVGRYKQFQVGLFSSFKNVSLSDYDNSGTLGQASLTADYLFGRGKVGLYGSKGFLEKSLIQSRRISGNIFENSYVRTVDQIGLSGAVGLWDRTWAEGNLGYLSGRQAPSRAGGTMRLVVPFADHWAFTAEGGVNETLLSSDTYGRWAVGVRFGNFMNPKEYAAANHPVPVDIPRVRWEIVTERIRTGNDPPVADAGPDLVNVPAGQITLDGSNSTDADGDPLTFQWTQTAGPTVNLTGPDKAIATFTAEDGDVYVFRLTVTDDQGASAADALSISTRETPRPRILQFTVTPNSIRAGEPAKLSWQVENADEVEIDNGIGSVNTVSGVVEIMPVESTIYTITATNSAASVTMTVLVSVNTPRPTFLRCDVTPQNIGEGESATISWQVENADEVNLTGFGTVPTSGSQSVSPTANTTYTLTATNVNGSSSCPLTLQVTPRQVPQIVRFTGNPLEIVAGTSATLQWQVENADEIRIDNGIGIVSRPDGAMAVSPIQNTAYTITARNRNGETSATLVIHVIQPARVISFTATPADLANPNDLTVLSWSTTSADQVTISGLGVRPANGSVAIRPTATTTYTLVANNNLSEDTATTTVTVGGSGP